jgi:hypothetical protein
MPPFTIALMDLRAARQGPEAGSTRDPSASAYLAGGQSGEMGHRHT